jgi:hypothetical protein
VCERGLQVRRPLWGRKRELLRFDIEELRIGVMMGAIQEADDER